MLDVGRLGAALADDDRAERAAERVERVVRAVVVVGPDADGVRRRLPRVGELLARRDEAADARVVAEVDAVVVGRVADAVRVQRERLVELRRRVAEVDDERVADLGVQRRARHQGRPGRSREARLHPLVDERAEVALAGDRAAVPAVAAGRRDVPAARARLDPVLARATAGLRLGRGEAELVLRRGAARALDLGGHGVGTARSAGLVEADLLAADRAEQCSARGEAEEGSPCRTVVGHRNACQASDIPSAAGRESSGRHFVCSTAECIGLRVS